MKKCGEIDIKLGQNIVKHRVACGFSRKDLAENIGITHQQLQKYEKGINRISVARLFDVAKALKVSVEELINVERSVTDIAVAKSNRSMIDIVKYINKIEDETKLDAIRNLVKSISMAEVRVG